MRSCLSSRVREEKIGRRREGEKKDLSIYIFDCFAEKLSKLMSENIGLENDYIKKAFSGSDAGPAMGTKVTKYPQCPSIPRTGEKLSLFG